MLLDLSLITRTLITLIRTHVEDSPAWPVGLPLTVAPDPPDKLADQGDNVIGLYLYHLSEEAAFKNVQAPGGAPPDVRFAPMALNLFYVLRAHANVSDEATLREQQLMGCAVKALHDYPIIDEHTRVATSPTVPILHNRLVGGDRLRISLQPVPPQEAVAYWTAGQAPIRLAAYYQVSVILLEPDVPNVTARRVLLYGVNAFVGQAPQLQDSRSRVRFRLPGAASAQELEVLPAQAAIGDEIVLSGAQITGDAVSLSIRAPGWADAVEVDAAWGVVASGDRVFARVQASAAGRPVHPGIYSAQVSVRRRLPQPDGTLREVSQASNAVPLLIAPGVAIAPGDAPFATDADGAFTVTGSGFDVADLEVFVGDARLAAHPVGPTPLEPGTFLATSATQLQVRVPAGLSGRVLGLRVVAGGVESPPRWVSPS